MIHQPFDSLIFDMDGTLWDAVDTYCRIWNETYRRMGVESRVTRRQLIECMGYPIDRIVTMIAPPDIDRERFYRELARTDDDLMPRLGGRLYPGVERVLPELAARYRLFMVSNCGARGLEYFLTYTGLTPWFTDTLSFGQTHLPKEGNIRILCERYSLKSPVYIGDTAGDCRSAHAAGIPMIHARYGFGKCSEAEYSIDCFSDLEPLLLK